MVHSLWDPVSGDRIYPGISDHPVHRTFYQPVKAGWEWAVLLVSLDHADRIPGDIGELCLYGFSRDWFYRDHNELWCVPPLSLQCGDLYHPGKIHRSDGPDQCGTALGIEERHGKNPLREHRKGEPAVQKASPRYAPIL